MDSKHRDSDSVGGKQSQGALGFKYFTHDYNMYPCLTINYYFTGALSH